MLGIVKCCWNKLRKSDQENKIKKSLHRQKLIVTGLAPQISKARAGIAINGAAATGHPQGKREIEPLIPVVYQPIPGGK